MNIFLRAIKKVMYLGVKGNNLSKQEEKSLITHNSLAFSSLFLLSVFPILFTILQLYSGLYLIGIGLAAVVIPLILNSKHLFYLSRITGISLGLGLFLGGLVLYGYDVGFLYGIMIILISPILFFRKLSHRLATFTVLCLIICLTFFLLADYIPIIALEERERSIIQNTLFITCTLLLISQTLSIDWINNFYESQNRTLLKELTQRNEELTNFSYSAAHDFKEPLQTILNFVDLFKKKKKNRLDTKEELYLNIIVEACDKLNSLLDAILVYNKLGQSSKNDSIDCNILLEEVLKKLKADIIAGNAQIELKKLPVLTGNDQEISLVFQNLLLNAIQYKREGVQLKIQIGAVLQGRYWRFHVQDNGMGVDKNAQGKIFRPFQRGQSQGSSLGIGLANCKKIISSHFGKIWIESEENKGSTIYFTLKK